MVGDDDGIVVLSDAELAAAIETAEAIQRREGRIRSAIQDGTSLFEQLNFAEQSRTCRPVVRARSHSRWSESGDPYDDQLLSQHTSDGPLGPGHVAGIPCRSNIRQPNSTVPCRAIGLRHSLSFQTWLPSSASRLYSSRTSPTVSACRPSRSWVHPGQ